MKERFVEPELRECPMFSSMMDEILVVCPACQSRARLASTISHGVSELALRRLVCEECGLVRNWSGKGVAHSWWSVPPMEPYFGLPLWLCAPCCSKTLWFLNHRHMELVEQYVRAELREKRRDPERGWFNGSLFNRLPRFVKEAKHREEVLRAIAVLKLKV